jgi:thiol-disulfide isomerase/thioredoxin
MKQIISMFLIVLFSFSPTLVFAEKPTVDFPAKAEKRGWLGVGLEGVKPEDDPQKTFSFEAVRVRKVFRNSPAEASGFLVGDFIVSIQEKLIEQGVRQMVAHVQSHEQGTTVAFGINRAGKNETISVILAAFPNQKKLLESEWKNRSFPDVSFENLESKERMKLSEQKGKVVVIDYWATWCAPCRKAAPKLEKIAEAYEGKDLLVVGISSEEREVLEVYDRNNPASYPILLDSEGAMSKVIGASSLPTFMVIDQKGLVQKIVVGMNGVDEVSILLKKLLP